MVLFEGCTLVASGDLGFGITAPWDGHAYLVRSGDTAVLVDSGSGLDADSVADRIDASLDGARLHAILLTHSHLDHSGGAAELSERYDAAVLAHEVAARRLADADEEAIGLPDARRDGTYPASATLRPVPRVEAADTVAFGQLTGRSIAAPGHSADSLVWEIEFPGGLALFTGDVVFAQGRVAVLDTPDTDPSALERSIRTLAARRPTYLLPGHGAVALGRGWVHLDAAVAAYDRGGVPPGLVA